jgi:hypothetical protein
MTPANNTLANLLIRVQRLIEQQGADAPCAAWIYTNEDVFTWSEDGGDQVLVDRATAAEILYNVEDNYDYIYSEIFDRIDDELIEKGLKK